MRKSLLQKFCALANGGACARSSHRHRFNLTAGSVQQTVLAVGQISSAWCPFLVNLLVSPFVDNYERIRILDLC